MARRYRSKKLDAARSGVLEALTARAVGRRPAGPEESKKSLLKPKKGRG